MIGRRPAREETGFQELVPNLTPLLDVLFMLLIFLVLSANTAQYALELALPATRDPAGPVPVEAAQVVITLPREGEAMIVDTEVLVGWEQARPLLAAKIEARPDAWFLIAGDRETALERVVQVLAFLQAQGVRRSRILVQQE